MKLSSRWSVSALVAICALGCSDPVAPPAQGAFNTRVTSASPAPAGKSCPSGASTFFEVPVVPPATTVDETLDDQTYLHWVIDGEDGAGVACTVQGNGSFFEGRISSGGKTLDISSGTLDATLKGKASITIGSSSQISGSLSSPPVSCTINASNAGGTRYEVAPGHIWATFDCSSVERQPSDYCAARGTFVLENCNK
ncbi:MAG: hypothetical protein EOO73_27075 [Myxococcales bacterium]|nr:MAG: hypothetical protein EOO73_27075 [Myxococcales bacterium]